MRIGKKIFPYPVLNNIQHLSNYLDCRFEVYFDLQETNFEIKLNDLKFETDSELLNNLYKEEKIDVICIVECSDTVFRRKFKIKKIEKDLILYKADLSEKTYITFFAYATQNITIRSNEFDEDYQNIDFQIDKYDILASNDDKFLTIEHQEKEDELNLPFLLVNKCSRFASRFVSKLKIIYKNTCINNLFDV